MSCGIGDVYEGEWRQGLIEGHGRKRFGQNTFLLVDGDPRLLEYFEGEWHSEEPRSGMCKTYAGDLHACRWERYEEVYVSP